MSTKSPATMNAILDQAFKNLETSLSTLIESISLYNPSPLAASAVIVADNEMSKSLELRKRTRAQCGRWKKRGSALTDFWAVVEHQENYHKIQTLKATSEALDQRLVQLLSALAEVRKEIHAVPRTKFYESRSIRICSPPTD